MAWIELHQSVYSHRKTLRLARLLSLDRWSVVGRISALWNWALDSAQDGVVPAEDSDFIADVMGWEGDPEELITALLSAGFLEWKEDNTYFIHDWWDFGGKMILARRADAERKRTERAAKHVQRTSNGHPEDVQPPSGRRVEQSTVQQNMLKATSSSVYSKAVAGKEGQAAAAVLAAGVEKQNGRTQNAILADLPPTITEKFSQGQIEKEFDKWQSWVADHPKSSLTLKQFLSWMDKVRPEDVIPPHETDVQRITRIMHSKPNEKGLLDGPDENGHIDRQTYYVWEGRLRDAKRLEETRAREERCRERAAIEALYASGEAELVQDESGNHKTPT